MKALVLFSSLFFATSAFAHGEIESIHCEDKAQKLMLHGMPAGKDNVFKVELFKAGKVVSKNDKAQLKLKDVVQGKTVVEEITFSLDNGTAKLMIPEDYSLEVRPGTGTVKTAAATADMKCKVTY